MAFCVPQGFTYVTDFQGQVLDSIGNGNTVDHREMHHLKMHKPDFA